MKNEARQGTPHTAVERRWQWAALCLSVAVLSIGCSPIQQLGYFIFMANPNIPPDFEQIAKHKDAKVIIVSTCATTEVRPELLGLENQLGDVFAVALRQRYQENGDRVTILPPYQVRSYLMSRRSNGLERMVEVGKHFKADYVIALEIHNNDGKLSLYQPGSNEMFFRGIAEISVRVFDTSKPPEEAVAWDQNKHWEYPRRGPQDVRDTGSWQNFRATFVRRMVKDLVPCFAGHLTEHKSDCDD